MPPDCDCGFEAKNAAERRTLVIVLAVNAVMFLAEFTVGIFAVSVGLTADSLDMFADASVYAISLYAVGRAASIRHRAAFASGLFQIVLGVGVLVEVVRRFVIGSEPLSGAMIAMGIVALVANGICLLLLAKHRHGDVNLWASWIFSTNDVIANAGVIVSGILVWLTHSRYPDLVIGFVIAALVVRGGLRIISEVKSIATESNRPFSD